MALQFYRGPNTEPYLARVDSTSRRPEVFWENLGQWVPYPELNTLTEADPISRAQALAQVPGMTEAMLDAPRMPAPPKASAQ